MNLPVELEIMYCAVALPVVEADFWWCFAGRMMEEIQDDPLGFDGAVEGFMT